MKKNLIFAMICAGVCVTNAYAATRGAQNSAPTARQTATVSSVHDTPQRTSERNVASRNAQSGASIVRRGGAGQSVVSRGTSARATTVPGGVMRRESTTAMQKTPVHRGTPARASSLIGTAVQAIETRTGAAYDQCKTAYFACMDQFCQLKNDDYRRCSCSDRVYELAQARETLQSAGAQLTVFTENLDVVGMTATQAAAMKNASAGENALASDKSASKALLQAIMNSIRGTDSSVSGKYSDLNSINLSMDTVNAFGAEDSGQLIATYDGQNLYSAVYPQCRRAVKDDCNDASLQRAITAYLMAIEQDCNTVQTAIETTRKETKSALREGSAMLDLARVENRKKHNTSDLTTCVNEIESAILSEEVCGTNYHKCLDNGEFIDVTTGKPIAGVENFYELGKLLTFANGTDAANQKLSKVSANRIFVANFEKRVRKFAEPALDKCTDIADNAWSEYLDRALLAIYYAQKSKVDEIKRGCFDFISNCYTNVDTGLTDAMRGLINDADLVLRPDKITLNKQMCSDYVASCNNMFGDGEENLITQYVETRQDTDTLAACRAVAQQCFDSFGGTNYENFYYPYSGLFARGAALDWFTLYDADGNLVSECARQLYSIESCKDNIEQAFGGFDTKYTTGNVLATGDYNISPTQNGTLRYGTVSNDNPIILKHHVPRPTGVATEVYNQTVDILATQCMNLQGRFLELQYLNIGNANYSNLDDTNHDAGLGICLYANDDDSFPLAYSYRIGIRENMCPYNYNENVDTTSWGSCLCWENGGRRSKWGTATKCMEVLPIKPFWWDNNNPIPTYHANGAMCNGWYTGAAIEYNNNHPTDPLVNSEVYFQMAYGYYTTVQNRPHANEITPEDWCTVETLSLTNQVCAADGLPTGNGQIEAWNTPLRPLLTDDQRCGTLDNVLYTDTETPQPSDICKKLVKADPDPNDNDNTQVWFYDPNFTCSVDGYDNQTITVDNVTYKRASARDLNTPYWTHPYAWIKEATMLPDAL